MESLTERGRVLQRAYNICMKNLQELVKNNFDTFNQITSDYSISITPLGIFKDNNKITKLELQDFITSKRPEYGK